MFLRIVRPLEPEEFRKLVSCSRNISLALGRSEKKISKSEIKNSILVRKSIFAKKNILKGEVFSSDNICIKRPGSGLSPMNWDNVIGIKAKKNFKVNDFITID